MIPESEKDFEQERQAHSKPVVIRIETNVPSKWRFVDLETGDVWRWDENYWGYGEKGGFRQA